MPDQPALTDLLDSTFSSQSWVATSKVNRNASGTLIGAVPEAQANNKPTAEWGNGVSACLQQLSTFVRGTASVNAWSIANTLKLPVYTTAGRPAAGTQGLLIYDSDLDALYIDDGSAWNAVTPSINGYDVLETIYEVDFSSLANNTFADGTEVIDSLSWTAANTSAATSFGVVNGSGIVWTAPTSSTTTFTTTSQTAALIYIDQSSIPNWVSGKDTIIDLHISASTFENGNERITFGLWGVAASPLAANVARIRAGVRGNNGGTQTIGTLNATSTTFVAETLAPTVVSTIVRADGSQSTGYGTYAAGWPTIDYVLSNNADSPATSGIDVMQSGSVRLALAFSSFSDASPTTTVTVANMRIRQR